MKLNVLIAVTDSLRIKFKGMVNDYTKFFKNHQTNFLGLKNTFVVREGMIDDLSKRKVVKVTTTVDEKLGYFKQESEKFIDALFSQEKTNASGTSTAELVVEGTSWGIFTSLELLRLKSLLEASDLGNIETLLSNIPVRSDAEVWEVSNNPEYEGRGIWQTPLVSGETKTTAKEEYILPDPNIERLKGANYTPKVAQKTTVQIVGDFTNQDFSGAWSHLERANALKRRSELLVAVVKALKEANECEMKKSALTADKIYGYIFNI